MDKETEENFERAEILLRLYSQISYKNDVSLFTNDLLLKTLFKYVFLLVICLLVIMLSIKSFDLSSSVTETLEFIFSLFIVTVPITLGVKEYFRKKSAYVSGFEWFTMPRNRIAAAWKRRSATLTGIEKIFAETAFHNYISRFDVDNGKHIKGKPTIDIHIEWHNESGKEVTLRVYRDTELPPVDIPSIKLNETAIQLDTAKHDDDIHVVDNEGIIAGQKYYYYAWLETEIEGKPIAFAGHKKTIIASAQETFSEYVARKEVIEADKRRLRDAIQTTTKPLPEADSVAVGLVADIIKEVEEREMGLETARMHWAEETKGWSPERRRRGEALFLQRLAKYFGK